jgi:predicted secreted Zn-dependent protease
MKRAILALILIGVSGPTSGQSFTCRIGQTAACLDWGNKVCSSNGKCVSNSASCFDSYQCDYQGFACKSAVNDCVTSHDRLVRDYNELLANFKTLRESHGELQSDFDSLQWQKLELQRKHDALDTCLRYAGTLDDAQSCLP